MKYTVNRTATECVEGVDEFHRKLSDAWNRKFIALFLDKKSAEEYARKLEQNE